MVRRSLILRRAGQVVLGLSLLLVAAIGVDRADLRAGTGLPLGAHDYIAYWAAHDVAVDGGDPYDEGELLAAERRLHPRYETEAQRFWSPPWALVVLGPVLALPWELSVAVWMMLSIAAVVLCAFLGWRLFVVRHGEVPPLALGASILFLPVFETLLLGQLGAFIAATTLGGLLALRRQRDGVAGALLALNIVKPQVAFLVLVAVAVPVILDKRWRVVAGAAVTSVALAAGSVVLYPSAWEGWSPLEGSPVTARSATVASWIRAALPAAADGRPTWPLVVVPLVAILAVVACVGADRGRKLWRWMPSLLALTVLAAPYASIYDAVLLMPIQTVVVGAAWRRRPGAWLAVAALVAIQVAVLVLRAQEWSGLHHLVVLPLALLVLALCLPPSYAPATADA